ncbi:MAG: glycosyltransferase [Lachnospiraceae bacterium]|nr:glycosyltransferase [Lachnospiraceae bacterium]
MTEKKISVIIPCYNVSAWIDRCLQSVAQQSIGMEELQIICVDDCSTDDTLTKLKAWEEKYPEAFLLIESETNGRQGAARNIGLSYAEAEWIVFLDSDDWLEPLALEKLYGKAAGSAYDMVIGDNIRDKSRELRYLTENERKNGKADHELRVENVSLRRKLIRENLVSFAAWGRIIRKSFLKENSICFPEGLAYEDIYWGSLINYYVRRVYFIEEKLYHYFVNDASTILKSGDYHTDMLTVNVILWREVHRRGLDAVYRDEIECELIYSGLLAFLKVIALRFETPPYSLYRLLGAFAEEYLPQPRRNPYYAGLPEFHRLMLDALYMEMNKRDFRAFIEDVKRIGL